MIFSTTVVEFQRVLAFEPENEKRERVWKNKQAIHLGRRTAR